MFRGFRVKPATEGITCFVSDDDVLFSGSTDRFEFLVIAKDIEEANSFAKAALGTIQFKWELCQTSCLELSKAQDARTII